MGFKDHFSSQAKEYSRYRPKYPAELFEYLSSLVRTHDTAWDCATGSGQAAIGLTPWFNKVIATDASASQIEHSFPHPKITYKIAAAENTGLEGASVDLVTVATAIHWINTGKFYPEVRRIVKPGGVIAVWGYSWNSMEPEIDEVLKKLFYSVIESYWPIEAKNAWNFEESVNFPFTAVNTPKFGMKAMWNLKEYLSYLYTWSSTQNYIKQTGKNPLEISFKDILNVWGDEETKREVSWNLKIKVGRL